MININVISMICTDGFLLLAGQKQYVHMGRRFRRRGNDIELTDLLLPLLIVGCVIGIAWLVTQYLKFRERRQANSPHALFHELCRAHGLDWANQQLLRSIAKALRLPTPAHVFTDPKHFNVQKLGGNFAKREAQINTLRAKLFATTSTTDHTSPE